MNAGRELDALVAERVMGWTKKPTVHGFDAWWYASESTGEQVWSWAAHGDSHDDRVEWRPSSEIRVAWVVVQKCMDTLELEARQTFRYELCLRDADILNDDATVQICLAALKALGVEVPA